MIVGYSASLTLIGGCSTFLNSDWWIFRIPDSDWWIFRIPGSDWWIFRTPYSDWWVFRPLTLIAEYSASLTLIGCSVLTVTWCVRCVAVTCSPAPPAAYS